MSWAFPHIPQRLLLYWGHNQPLSWLRYMTVESFVRLNPDWKVWVFHPLKPVVDEPWLTPEHESSKWDGKDHFADLLLLPNVQVLPVDWEAYPMCRGLRSEVHRSDFLRYSLLHHVGGVWSDFDILWFRPMSCFHPSHDCPEQLTSAVCWMRTRKLVHHSIGFLMGSENSPFWGGVLSALLQEMKAGRDAVHYQQLGRSFLDAKFPWESSLLPDVGNLPSPLVYPVLSSDIEQAMEGRFFSPPADSIGFHWFAGHRAMGRGAQAMQATHHISRRAREIQLSHPLP